LIHPEEQEQEQEQATEVQKTSELQQKVNTTFGTNEQPAPTLSNPFVEENGELVNPQLNYQSLLNNPDVSQTAKRYITQATGLTPTNQSNTRRTVEPLSYSSIQRPNTDKSTVKQLSSARNQNSYQKISDLIGLFSQNDNTQSNKTAFTNNGSIGFISAKYESGGNGGAVSSGEGDAGGVSYGISQFSSKAGSADKFVSWLKQSNPKMAGAFKNYKAGTTEFSNAWKQTFSSYGEQFTQAQQQYTYDNYVKPLAELAKRKTGIDYTRSTALRELLYSTAIQFGSGSLGLSALGKANANMSDTDIINASYDNKIANYKSYFKSSSSSVQESVKNRFVRERQDVLQLVSN
jgi:hypothetical protein